VVSALCLEHAERIVAVETKVTVLNEKVDNAVESTARLADSVHSLTLTIERLVYMGKGVMWIAAGMVTVGGLVLGYLAI
jgi:hypothetical protein